MKPWRRLRPTATTGQISTDDEHDAMIAFHVIGELRTNPRHLLVHGDDGRYYGYDLETGDIRPIELDERWMVDVACPMGLRIVSRSESIAS